MVIQVGCHLCLRLHRFPPFPFHPLSILSSVFLLALFSNTFILPHGLQNGISDVVILSLTLCVVNDPTFFHQIPATDVYSKHNDTSNGKLKREMEFRLYVALIILFVRIRKTDEDIQQTR